MPIVSRNSLSLLKMPAILLNDKDEKFKIRELSKMTNIANKLNLSENTRFMACCFMWYLSSSLSSNTGKQIMNLFKYPVTLTFVQFLFVACWCFIVENFVSSRSIKKPTRQIIETIVPLSLFMIVGHIFSSISISKIPVSLVHTIKVNKNKKKSKVCVN